MYYFVLSIHVIVCLVLITIILVQGGRGGLGEALGGGGSQSLFGGGTNVLIAKVTAIGGAIFFITCLTLAILSTARGRSVIEKVPAVLPDALGSAVSQPQATVPVSDEAELPAQQQVDVSVEPAEAMVEDAVSDVEATVDNTAEEASQAVSDTENR